MVAELRPGVPTAIFARVIGEVKVRGPLALTPVADELKREAKANASQGRHTLGTKTPASPGGGPAQISGTLVRSIDRSPVIRIDRGWMCEVGVAGGYMPYYGRKSSDAYSYILEITGCRNGAHYPFLEPAFDMVAAFYAPAFFTSVYGSTWGRFD